MESRKEESASLCRTLKQLEHCQCKKRNQATFLRLWKILTWKTTSNECLLLQGKKRDWAKNNFQLSKRTLRNLFRGEQKLTWLWKTIHMMQKKAAQARLKMKASLNLRPLPARARTFNFFQLAEKWRLMPTLILVSLSSAQHNKLSMSMKMSTKKEENNCFLLSLTLKLTEIVCLSRAMMRKTFTTRWMERSLISLCQSALGRTWLLSKSNKTNRCRTPTTTIKKWLQLLEFQKQWFRLAKKVRK